MSYTPSLPHILHIPLHSNNIPHRLADDTGLCPAVCGSTDVRREINKVELRYPFAATRALAGGEVGYDSNNRKAEIPSLEGMVVDLGT